MNETQEWQDEEIREQSRRRSFWFYAVMCLMMLAIIGFTVYRNRTYAVVTVVGSSMNQTLQSGQKLLMSRDIAKMQRGDIIIVDTGDNYIVKRLIAVEGDSLYCKDGKIFLLKKGAEEEVLLSEPYAYYAEDKSEYDFDNIYLKEGEIFFLGDNRFNSLDSLEKPKGEPYKAKNPLYKETDVIGYIPKWTMEEKNAGLVEFLYFGKNSCAGNKN